MVTVSLAKEHFFAVRRRLRAEGNEVFMEVDRKKYMLHLQAGCHRQIYLVHAAEERNGELYDISEGVMKYALLNLFLAQY